VVDQVIQSVEEHFVLKKRKKAGPVDKKPRFSSSSFEGGRGGRGGEGKGRKGRARRRAYVQLVRPVLIRSLT
jgi:hypothetical protein